MPLTCTANPGGLDGHTHDMQWLDTLTGNGMTAPGGMDGHSHQVVGWEALAGSTSHTHHVTCAGSNDVQGGGGVGCGF